MLLSEFDPCRDAVINPEMCIKGKIENFPEVTVSCFSHHLFEAVLAFFEPEEIGRVGGANGKAPVYAVTYRGKRIGFYESRVGEPACIGDYEDLLAMGMKNLILFGNCGVLDKTMEDGEDDYTWLRRGYATITVLTFDLTHDAATKALADKI